MVSAPGKSILIGEHAAVYGRPAVVAAVDLRLFVACRALDERSPGGGLRIELPGLPTADGVVPWSALVDEASRCREAWERYRDEPTPARFAALRGEQPGHLIRLALGEARGWLERHAESLPAADAGRDDLDDCVWNLRLASDLPLGAGFGSSAALAVAVIQTVFDIHGVSIEPGTLEAGTLETLALEVERRQHGAPSGVDGATVLRGGVLMARRDATNALVVEPLAADPALLAGFRAVHTGPPSEETGAVVSAVRGLRDRDPRAFEARLDAMAGATEALAACLRARDGTTKDGTPKDDAFRNRADLHAPLAPLRAFARQLEALGVVPEPVRRVTAAIEAVGGAAKISGAGSLHGPGAGSLLLYHPDPAVLDEIALPDAWRRLDLRYGADGVRREPDDVPLA